MPNQNESAPKTSNEIDWVGAWFPIIESFGEVIPCVTFQVNSKTNEILSWNQFPHDKHDGIGSLREVLQKQGRDPGEAPVLKFSEKPSGIWKWLTILQFLRDSRIRRVQW